MVLLLDVARCRAAARVLCRLDAGEKLRLDAAVGRSWTSRFPSSAASLALSALWLRPPLGILHVTQGTSRFPLAKCRRLPLTRAPPPVRLSHTWPFTRPFCSASAKESKARLTFQPQSLSKREGGEQIYVKTYQ